jgi:hypothetical protein
MSSSIMSFLNNETSRLSFIKCIYCYEENHLYKKECAKLNENSRAERIHLQKKRIHLDFYNFDVFHVRRRDYDKDSHCAFEKKR